MNSNNAFINHSPLTGKNETALGSALASCSVRGFNLYTMSSVINKPHALYYLKDPFTNKIKYVGITSNIKNRKRQHIFRNTAQKNPRLLAWVELLKSQNAFPEIEVVKEFQDYESAHRFEILIINKYKETLYNIKH
jgi:predicted GIY-YIG superfamily endonuclease